MNQMACHVFGNFEEMNDLEHNLVWRMFAIEKFRKLFVDWEYMAKGLLAQLRSFYGKYAEDPWYKEIVAQLIKISPEFNKWWQEHEIYGIPDFKKDIHHPILGLLEMDYNSFLLAENKV